MTIAHPSITSLLRVPLAVVVVAVLGCGGKVVFDEGLGGAHGSSTHASTSASTTGTGTSCAALQKTLKAAIAAGSACNPNLGVVQCDASMILKDPCECPQIILNESEPAKAAAAQKAYDDWSVAGCPKGCGTDCAPPNGGFCQANGDGTGVCVATIGF